MQNPGRVLRAQQLLDAVWGRDVYVDERTVDVHIGRLRKALMQMAAATRSARCAAPATPSAITAVSFTRLPLQLRRHDIKRPLSFVRENGPDTWAAGVSADEGQDIVAIGAIELDWTKKSVTRMGRDIRLRIKEFYLLGLLISNPGRTYAREDIRRIVWWRSSIDLRTVDATIGGLRRAINRGYLPDPIMTVLEQGYKFCESFDQIHSAWLAGGNRKLRLSKTRGEKTPAGTSARPVGD